MVTKCVVFIALISCNLFAEESKEYEITSKMFTTGRTWTRIVRLENADIGVKRPRWYEQKVNYKVVEGYNEKDPLMPIIIEVLSDTKLSHNPFRIVLNSKGQLLHLQYLSDGIWNSEPRANPGKGDVIVTINTAQIHQTFIPLPIVLENGFEYAQTSDGRRVAVTKTLSGDTLTLACAILFENNEKYTEKNLAKEIIVITYKRGEPWPSTITYSKEQNNIAVQSPELEKNKQ